MSPPQQQNHHQQHPNHDRHPQNHRRHIVRVGGPNSRLPRFVESLFSWSLCLSCLSVSGYHYCISTYIKPLWSRLLLYSNNRQLPAPTRELVHCFNGENRSHPRTSRILVSLPLTTHSQREMESKTVMERYNELCLYLSRVYNIHLVDHHFLDVETSKENLIDILRKDIIARRLASLVMMGQWGGARSYHRRLLLGKQCLDVGRGGERYGMLLQGGGEQDQRELPVLMRFLMNYWNRLLEFPLETENTSFLREYEFEITLVVPSYGETTVLLQRQMKKWYKHCKEPEQVEVILVDAGGKSEGRRNGPDDDCNDFLVMGEIDGLSDDLSWGCVRVLKYSGGGGRGSCLNYGAAAARGRILTFCHLDTTLPQEWDDKIRNVLLGCGDNVAAINGVGDNHRGSGNAARRGEEGIVRVNACAFGFGIDTSKEGLGNGPYPPGIRAVEKTANIRTHLFVLPYGDQALSLTNAMFDFLGGFPDQCLMEDYELVVLLRKRAALFKTSASSFGYQEVLKIVPGQPALCSPRRWQKFGVLYVTFMNSKFINLYCGGLGPDQLYKLYYGCDPPKRESELSPWEEELQKILSAND